MRVLIDTNVLISAILYGGVPLKAYKKAVTYPNRGVLCSQNIDELRRIFNRKFPKSISNMEKFLSFIYPYVEIIDIPEEKTPKEDFIRDENDKAILRAAISANVDIILTGDKDFLESGIENPQIITAKEFNDIY